MKKYMTKFNIIILSILFLLCILLVLDSLFSFENPVKYFIKEDNNLQSYKMESNETITIDFISKVNKLEAIEIPFNDNKAIPQKDSIKIKVYDFNNKEIYNEDINNIMINYNETLYLKFKKINNSKDKNIKIVISSKKLNELFELKTLNYKEDSIKVSNSNESINSIPITQYGYDNTSIYSTLLLITIFVLLFILFRHNFKNNKALKDKFIKNKCVFIIELLVSIICFISYILSKYNGGLNYKYYLIFIISTVVLLFILSMYVFDKDLKKEDLFLLIGIPISTMFLVFMIPSSIPDFSYHYYVTKRMSNLNIFGTAININSIMISFPENYSDLINNYINIKSNSYTQVISGNYHPLLYLVSGLGMLLAKLFNLGPYISIYLGVLFNQILFLIVGYFIVKKIPFGKLLIIFYMLMPMFMQQTISLSADSLLNIFSMLFIAYVLYIKYNKKSINTKDFIVLLVSILFILIGKYAYIFMLILLLLIKKELKNYIKDNKKIALSLIGIIIFIILGWLLYTKINDSNSLYNLAVNRRVSSKEKLLFILSNPINIIAIISNTLSIDNISYYMNTTLGGKLGATNIEISPVLIYMNLILLILSIFTSNKKEPSKTYNKLSIIIVLLCFCSVFAGLYLTWGPVTEIVISGVQGRYFLPFLILLPLMFISKDKVLGTKNYEPVLITLFMINSLLIISEVITFFMI